MSVNEARVGDQSGRVRMFGQDKLSSDVSKEKWDVVRVIATQPFNKHTKYGVSFVSLTGPNKVIEPDIKPVAKIGAFQLKTDDDEDNISIGSYFAKKKDPSISVQEENSARPSVAASLRSDKTLAEMALSSNKKKDNKRKLELTSAMKDEVKRRKVERNFPSRLSLPGEEEEKMTTPAKKIKVKEEKVAPSRPAKGKDEKAKPTRNETQNSSVERPPKSKPKVYSKFNEMLKGVHFAISGFQNPLRGEIRQKALDMGGRYHGDWNSSCTHLVCAFTNTPKFNQVKGKGKIVKKDWIEECHLKRMRFPWRRYALEKADLKHEESEDEILEEVSANDYDCDTDEEIERIKTEELKSKAHVTSNSYDCDTDEEEEKPRTALKNSFPNESPNPWEDDTDDEDVPVKSDEDLYGADTDIDEDMLPQTSQLSLEKLPNFFEGLTFFIGQDIKSGELDLVKRYIVGAGGSLQSKLNSKVTHLVTKNANNKEPVKSAVILIKPAWIFNCYDDGLVTNVEKYLAD